jgi:hypothetical protein
MKQTLENILAYILLAGVVALVYALWVFGCSFYGDCL